jgi:hypothetical protein
MNTNRNERKAEAAALRLLEATDHSLLAAQELERARRDFLAAVESAAEASQGPALALIRGEDADAG